MKFAAGSVVLTLLVAVVSAQFDGFGGGGGFGGKPQSCPKFKCPDGQTPLPKVGMTVHSSG
jgi:hypothetical protein